MTTLMSWLPWSWQIFIVYLIKLWWQFLQMFVYGDVVKLKIGRHWPWKTVTVSSNLHLPVRPMLLHRMALVSSRLFLKNLGNFQEFLGQMVYPPPPGAKKNARKTIKIKEACLRSSSFSNGYWFCFNPDHFENSTTRRSYQGERIIILKKK